jgi:hypothetical protein
MFVIHLVSGQKTSYWTGFQFQEEFSFNLMANSQLFNDSQVQTEVVKARQYAKDNLLLGTVVVKNESNVPVNPFKTIGPEAYLNSSKTEEFYIALEREGGYFISSNNFVRDSEGSSIILEDEDQVYNRANLVQGYNTFAAALRNDALYAPGTVLKIFDKN